MKNPMFQKHITITRPQLDQLKKLKSELGLTVSDLIRRAIDDYLKKNGPADIANQPGRVKR